MVSEILVWFLLHYFVQTEIEKQPMFLNANISMTIPITSTPNTSFSPFNTRWPRNCSVSGSLKMVISGRKLMQRQRERSWRRWSEKWLKTAKKKTWTTHLRKDKSSPPNVRASRNTVPHTSSKKLLNTSDKRKEKQPQVRHTKEISKRQDT